jgi:predicted nucleic acid-binding protein
MSENYSIEFINHKSKYLKDVVQLGDSNSKTLGHLPEVVYEEYARKGWILIIREKNILIGHCLFRKVKRINVVKIAQLCVSEVYRGKKVAEMLLDLIKDTFKDQYRGIGLNCRNDYSFANKLWKRNNFIPRKEKEGRAKKLSLLTYWFYSFNKPDLFSEINTDRVKALIDINIIIKLRDIEQNEDNAIRGLFNDTIISEIEYCYASETLFEIQRDKDRMRRERTRNLLHKFEYTNVPKDLLNGIANDLTEYFNENNENDQSDKNQVSEAILAGIQYFITTDEALIKKREKITEKHPIEILSPTEFLLQMDNIINEERYIGNRLAGTQVKMRNAKGDEVEQIVNKFIKIGEKEKKKTFKKNVNDCCTSSTGQLQVILRNEKLIGVWGIEMLNQVLSIRLLRVKEKQLKPYLFKQLITESIHLSLTKNINRIIYSEDHISPDEELILKSFSFINKTGVWEKLMIRDICSTKELFEKYPESRKLLKDDLQEDTISNEDKYTLERIFFPLKLTDLDIPTFIIPIKPFWASQLFDHYSASESLFGGKPTLLWNRENVYYRSVRPNVEKVPSRILWYVSSLPKNTRSKGILATSYLDEVHINYPKELFRRFKKYGIYEWKDVYGLAKENIENEIKVIEFSDTEVFKNVLKFEDIQEVVGKKITLQSPFMIDNSTFIKLYRQFI